MVGWLKGHSDGLDKLAGSVGWVGRVLVELLGWLGWNIHMDAN